ncbi:MAG: sigma-E factor negative regulatory protein [Acidiferrobacteraceae bacterium]
MKEKLSLLMDAELMGSERTRAISEIGADADLRSTWERYHIIRLSMRHEIDRTLPADFADRVCLCLEGQAVTGTSWAGWTAGRGGWATRLAIAASVATMVLFGLRMHHEEAGVSSALVATAQGPARLAVPLGAGNRMQEASFRARSVQGWQQLRPKWRHRLNAYLVEHNELAPEAGGSLMGYVRIVGYDRTSAVHASGKK